MISLPIAHAGHWALYVLYAVPIVVVLASVVFTVARDRRSSRRRDVSRSPAP